ncbi:hypothetical protein DA129_10105 [Salmonella enterica]|nr:hypothetical protein DA129_10105 [Salmonella enterica]
MSKDEISYQILYRYSLEKLYSTLTRRVDNVLSFALVFLGVGVTINVGMILPVNSGHGTK